MEEFISETACMRVCVCVTMQASEYAVVFCIVCGFMSQSTAILMPNRSVPISTLFFLDKLHKLDNQFCLFDLILYVPSTLFQLYRGGFPTLNKYLQVVRINVSCSRMQCSDAGEARTRGPSVSSQALYH